MNWYFHWKVWVFLYGIMEVFLWVWIEIGLRFLTKNDLPKITSIRGKIC